MQDNPSWLTLDLPRNRLYVLHGDGDRVAVFNRDPDTGLLSLYQDQTTGPRHSNPDLDPARRNNPVGAALTPDGNTLLIANHEGGNIAALPVSDQGLEPPVHLAAIEGHTPRMPRCRARMKLFLPREALFLPCRFRAERPVTASI